VIKVFIGVKFWKLMLKLALGILMLSPVGVYIIDIMDSGMKCIAYYLGKESLRGFLLAHDFYFKI